MEGKRTWFAKQTWNDVLFLHWPMAPKELRPFVEKPFELDTFDGQAWITIAIFQAKDSRLRGMPKFTAYRPFLQLNLRTYVVFNGRPGVYFLSIDSNRSLVVNGARLFSLPFVKAKMKLEQVDNRLLFKSHRLTKCIRQVNLSVDYRAQSSPFLPHEDTLNHWLVERYYLWTLNKNKIYEGLISHEPWKLQTVNLNLAIEELTPFSLDNHPLAHYSKTMQSYLYPFELKGFLG